MKHNRNIVILFLTFTILSCEEKPNIIMNQNLSNEWEELEINTRTEKIVISKFSDSVRYEQDLNNISFQILPEDGKIVREEIVKKNLYFTKSERDSLAKYIYETITDPKFTDLSATDYAGSVSFLYSTGNVKLICEYNTVGDWRKVSNTTMKIYKLISKKADISKN